MKRRGFLSMLMAAPLAPLAVLNSKVAEKPAVQTFTSSGKWTKPPLGSVETVTIGAGGSGSYFCPSCPRLMTGGMGGGGHCICRGEGGGGHA